MIVTQLIAHVSWRAPLRMCADELKTQPCGNVIYVSPYPTYGNEAMVINDGKEDKRAVNVGWLEVKYNGWPYLFIVALKDGVKRGTELLIDYSAGTYWENRRDLEYEHAGVMSLLATASKRMRKELES